MSELQTMRTIRDFASDRRGATAVIFALSLVPLLCAAGVAIDYARASTLRTALQSVADSTALRITRANYDGTTIDYRADFTKQFDPKVSYKDLNIDGEWLISDSQFRVQARVEVPTTLLGFMTPEMDVSVSATAEVIEPGIRPVMAMMDPEAADYNEVSAYCFDPATKKRHGMMKKEGDAPPERIGYVKLADNSDEGIESDMGELSELLKTLSCKSGEFQSYQMHNVRNARNNVAARSTNEAHDYFTDTTMSKDGSTAEFHTEPDNMIETIYCDTQEACSKEKSEGGDIPDQERDREPNVNTTACINGFLYMGWEDRRPSAEEDESDRDFNDIRLVMACTAKDAYVRLVE